MKNINKILIVVVILCIITASLLGCYISQKKADYNNNSDIPPHYNIEEWDYKVYSSYVDERCYGECIKKNNQTFCEVSCTQISRKLYSDSFCDINCSDKNFRIYINMTIEGTSIPAQYLDIYQNVSDKNCTYKCYGRFVGWSGISN